MSIGSPVRPAPGGLTGAEAAARLASDGPNEPPAGRRTTLVSALAHQLADVVMLVLLGAGVVTLAVGDLTDAAVIGAVVVLNTTLGAVQELRSGRALAALADLTAPRAAVVRDGRLQEIPARQVVRGDLVRLVAGNIVPADGTLVETHALQLDESLLTGESLPVARGDDATAWAATVVTRGRAGLLVTGTAGNTAVGAIARGVRTAAAPPTPVQRQLASLGRTLAAGVSVIALLVAALNIVGGRGVETSAVLAVSLAVAAIPESLPAVVSLALSMGACRMSSAGVLVRRLPAVEALGSVTVVAADKTGTLTEGRLTVTRVWPRPGTDREALLTAAVLCNDACAGDGLTPGRHDDPLEVALVRAAASAGVDVAAVRAAAPRVREEPFDAATARMTTWHRRRAGPEIPIGKGAPVGVLGERAADVAGAAADMTAAGLRVLAVVAEPDGASGLIGFEDPPRRSARGVIAALRRCGVRTVMVTGDHAATARAVARAVGIADTEQDVRARVRPEGKQAIVGELQARGEVVAMTGDGVNDAPALRAADVGVSLGARATEVARQAADLVLTADDLGPLVPAVAEGRRVYDNLRRFLHYAVSGGLAEVLVVLTGPLLGFALPLQAGQILWINLLTHGLPGVALGNEPAAADVLDRPPRPRSARLLDGAVARRIVVLAVAVAAASLASGLVARAAERPWQSCVFVTLTVAQLAAAAALAARGRPRGGGVVRWFGANPLLPTALALNLLLIGLAVTWGPLRTLLHTAALTPLDLLLCAAWSVPVALVALRQTRVRARDAGAPPAGERVTGG